jgi:5-(carboxyamino)imidazole ribonucleotide mutase
MKALVLFGSESDKLVYNPLVLELEKYYTVEFKVLSAHRDPEALRDKMILDDFDFLVAGAGLAAHLPGVAAAMTTKPVFGIAVEAQFGGMDAVMAISQMPYGIPVASLPPGNNKPMFDFLDKVKSLSKENRKMINIQIEPNLLNYEYVNKELDRLKALAASVNVELLINPENIDSEKLLCLQFVHEEGAINYQKGAMNIPLMEDSVRAQTKSAMTVQNWITKGGLWFGVNNSRNALLFLEKWK